LFGGEAAKQTPPVKIKMLIVISNEVRNLQKLHIKISLDNTANLLNTILKVRLETFLTEIVIFANIRT